MICRDMKTRTAIYSTCITTAAFLLVFICGHLFVTFELPREVGLQDGETLATAADELPSVAYSNTGPLLDDSSNHILRKSLQGGNNEGGHNGTIMQRDKKLILLWTEKFGVKDWLKVSEFKNCAASCEVTSHKSRLFQSDAIIFHAGDFYNATGFPRTRYHWQRWVYFGMESPKHTRSNIHTGQLDGVFNWTASYRQDADFTVGYGSTYKLQTPSSEKEHWRFKKTYIRSKPRLALARISHCHQITNHRLDYIRELKKYMDVDVYGDCGDHFCPKHATYCDYDLPKQYKFFLAFENSCCRDYITEKFWYSLGLFRSVPVVIGGASGHGKEYSYMAPPNSFINAANFKSAKKLALYLKLLDNNQYKYEKYFQWRKTHSVKYHVDWCRLCEALHDKTRPAQTITDFKNWYLDDVCQKIEPRGAKRDKCEAAHIV